MKRHLKQRTKECKALIYVVLVFLIVLTWMIISLIIGEDTCSNNVSQDYLCEFEQWMGNSKAYIGMEIALGLFRLCTVIVFEIALMNFWRSLKASFLINQDTKTFVVHFTLLIMYFLSETASLTLVIVSYFGDHMSSSSSSLWFANSLLWCVDGTANFIAMLFVVDKINEHYQKVKKMDKKLRK